MRILPQRFWITQFIRRHWLASVCVCSMAFWTMQTVSTQSRAEPATSPAMPHETAYGLDTSVLIGIAVILLVAKLGGELCERFKQPAVLGELTAGIILGNLALFGWHVAEPLKTNQIIGALAEFGVIILLFEVGLESNFKEMLEVGWSSLLVALAGVLFPFLLGWGVAAYFLPGETRLAHIFIGAVLCATSVGITARVLKDLGQLNTQAARIILGAAVIDDVLGLIILAVVRGAIEATGAGATLSTMNVVLIAIKAFAFLAGTILIGRYLVPHIFRGAGHLEGRGVLLALAISFCFTLSWAASVIGLAAIVGAFAAGLVLEEAHFEHFPDHTQHDLEELLKPVSALLVPIFFVLMGMKVDLRAFARLDLLGFACALTAAAITGKQVCSLVVVERKVNRLTIGIGMIPRGEVGLIFAGIGAMLMLPNAQGESAPIIDASAFSVIVIMVLVTTLITPPLLKWSIHRGEHTNEAPATS